MRSRSYLLQIAFVVSEHAVVLRVNADTDEVIVSHEPFSTLGNVAEWQVSGFRC